MKDMRQNQFTRDHEVYLMQMLHDGDVEAFRELYQQYAPGLKGFCQSFHIPEQEADDVVQETFKRIWEKRTTINPEFGFKTFIFTIAKNLIYNRIRSQIQVKRYEIALLAHPAHQRNEQQDIHLRQLIDKTISSLPEKCRQIFNKSRVEGKSNADIAAELALSKSTVENQINKALKRLRQVLRHSGYGAFLKSIILSFIIY